jgi:hypothetical protein
MNDAGTRKKAGTECQCDDPQCGKCLSSNCRDESCTVHTQRNKDKRKEWERLNRKNG